MFDEDGYRDLTPFKAGILGLRRGRWRVVEKGEFVDGETAFAWAQERGAIHAKAGRFDKVRASVLDTEQQEVDSLEEVCDWYNSEEQP